MRRHALLAHAVLLGCGLVLVSCGGDKGSPTTPDQPGNPGTPTAPNVLPTARFTASADMGTAPVTVIFDASASSDPDGTLVSFTWAFGDGTTGSGLNVSHTFTEGGSFEVRLTVRDDRSGEDVASDSLLVSSPVGNGTNSVEGVVWFDRDLDGRQDAGEPGLDRFPVFLDEDGDGERDSGEALTFTDQDGAYAFEGLDAGTTYTVTQALPFGWTNTTPGIQTAPPAAAAPPSRVINGEVTPIDPFPFQVALVQGTFQFCGGTLINGQYVLSAAHCVAGLFPQDVDVLLGASNLDGESERVRVTAIRSHPNFGNSLDYDVALLRLERPILRSRVFLQSPSQSSLSVPGTMATVIGWGQTEDGTASTELRRVDIPVITNALCSEIAGESYGIIGPRTICAGGRDLGLGPCYGDSGGPLLVPHNGSWLQIGIVSFNTERAKCGDLPAAFARVSELLDYIISVARIEPSGARVIDWSSGTTARADFGNFH